MKMVFSVSPIPRSPHFSGHSPLLCPEVDKLSRQNPLHFPPLTLSTSPHSLSRVLDRHRAPYVLGLPRSSRFSDPSLHWPAPLPPPCFCSSYEPAAIYDFIPTNRLAAVYSSSFRCIKLRIVCHPAPIVLWLRSGPPLPPNIKVDLVHLLSVFARTPEPTSYFPHPGDPPPPHLSAALWRW